MDRDEAQTKLNRDIYNDGCGVSPITNISGPAKAPYAEIEKLRTKDREDREKFHAQTEGPSPASTSTDYRLDRAVERLRQDGHRDKFQGETSLYQATALRAFIDTLPRTLSPLAAEGLNVLLNRAGL